MPRLLLSAATFLRRALVVLLPLVSACTLLYSTDGLDDPRTRDGGGAVSEAGGPDAITGDTTVVGASDAPSDVPTGDAGFCVPGAIFCDDFERADILGQWSSVTQNGGLAAIVNDTPTNHVFSAKVVAGDAAANVSLTKSTTVTVKNAVVIRARLRMPTSPTIAGVHALHLSFTNGTTSSTIFPYIFVNGITIAELVCVSGCIYTQSSAATFTPGVWHDVVLSVDFGVSPANYKLELDGVPVIQTTSAHNAFAGNLAVSAGIAAADLNHNDLEVDVDDLVVTGN